ncbi:hypothetical protein MBAV_005383 [Candidatus Magnetobacterium bavaricum]|uniref:Uncharacterized protein n=1 Tax=Candidatus Magnetobacterium bavaricum TaxID=29290 RepID=A0A0F3GP23_9BACT|nr:hypothetical protein MBAV_005383 [Candidatus Magnetobacterium bavaricum]
MAAKKQKATDNVITKAIAKRIERLKQNQGQRALVIEEVLLKFEKKMKPKTITEYKMLVEMQRGILGLDSKSQATPAAPFVINIDRGRREQARRY